MNQKGLTTFIIILLGVAIIALILGVFVVIKLFPSASYKTPQPTSSPSAPQQNPSSNRLDRLDAWTTIRSKVCNVEIPLPPNIAPYSFVDNDESSIYNDTGRFWQYHEYSSKFFGIFETTARAIFIKPEEGGGGYIPGAVEVMCSPNSEGYTTDTILTKLNKDLPTGITVKSREEVNMWKKKVFIYQFSGGIDDGTKGYVFTTTKNIYFVRKMVGSKNQIVKDTADEIFNKLNFQEKDTPGRL